MFIPNSLAFASSSTQSQTVLAPDVLALIQKNVPAGQYEEFRILLSRYFDAYAKESAGKQLRFIIDFAKSLLASNNSFDMAMQQATNAENQPAAQTPREELNQAEGQIDGPLAAALNALIQNMLTGTDSDFNHKVITLAGVAVFDPESAPAIYLVFKTINENYDNDAYFRGLVRDSKPSQQFVTGAAVVGFTAIALTYASPRTWGRLSESWSQLRGSLGDAAASLQRLFPSAAEDSGVASRELPPDIASDIANEKDPARRQMLMQLADMRSRLENIDNEFQSLGYKGAEKRTDARLLQDAMGGDAESQRELETRIKSGEVKINTAAKPLNLEKPLATRIFLSLLGEKPSSQFKTMLKIVGLVSAGGAANIGLHHMGLQKLYNHVYGPSNGWEHFLAEHVRVPFLGYHPFDFSTRVVPLDVGGAPDLWSHAYSALAALKFSCDVDAFTARVDQAKNVTNQDLGQLIGYLLEFQFLTTPFEPQSPNTPPVTPYLKKQFVPNTIQYDFKTRQIVMNLPEGRGTLHEQFTCLKYAHGFNSNRLEVSLSEDLEQLSQTYQKIQSLNAQAPTH